MDEKTQGKHGEQVDAAQQKLKDELADTPPEADEDTPPKA
ncbi:Rv0909 family putative TA system antitoxin [Kitasatospora sp. NPDC049285]